MHVLRVLHKEFHTLLLDAVLQYLQRSRLFVVVFLFPHRHQLDELQRLTATHGQLAEHDHVAQLVMLPDVRFFDHNFLHLVGHVLAKHAPIAVPGGTLNDVDLVADFTPTSPPGDLLLDLFRAGHVLEDFALEVLLPLGVDLGWTGGGTAFSTV